MTGCSKRGPKLDLKLEKTRIEQVKEPSSKNGRLVLHLEQVHIEVFGERGNALGVCN